MIAKARAISHGANSMRYVVNKDKADIIKLHLLPDNVAAESLWSRMLLHQAKFLGERSKAIKNNMIRIEVSPTSEETKGWTNTDWGKLADDFILEFDSIDLSEKTKRVKDKHTNLRNSQYVVSLHRDSKSGILHLHIDANRIDNDGNINNDHNIHLRAQRAAERIAKKRGWTTAVQIRYTNIHQVNRDCMDALRSMPEWSWEEYKNALTRKGYSVHERKDAQHVIRGYALVNGNTKYKASELGVARNLMISKLPKTWDKLHHRPQVVTLSNQPKETQTEQNLKPSASAEHTRYNTYHPDTISYTLNHDDKEHRFYIPEKVLEYFNDEFDYRDTENCQELTDMAVAIFVGLLETPNVATGSGGGGSQSNLPWRDKDEDDWQWARRCARAAGRLLGKKPKSGLKR